MTTMSTVLLGYRGSGKTTIGKQLAERLWQKFVDTDELVVRAAGDRTIREIFEQDGEPRFRELETAALKQALALDEHVIAIGGGAVGRQENRELLRDSPHKRIYLKCDPEELLKRIEADPETGASRPPLTELGGGIDEIRQVLEERESWYRQVMTAEVDVTHLLPDEAVVYIVRLL